MYIFYYSARTSKTQCMCVITLIWIAGLALSSPMAYAQRVVYVQEDWPFCQNVNLSVKIMLAYRALLVIVQYIIPLSIMTWAYSGIGFALWGSSAPGNAQSQRDLNLMRNKKRVCALQQRKCIVHSCGVRVQMNISHDGYGLGRYLYLM